jgi:uncharacterized hydrophobic protein (TIGR00271 family)
MKVLINKIFVIFKIEKELENYDAIHLEILRGIRFKGTNLWILFFAIIVASVGLNMNSTAVIIGAMLISPLMGPINGMGYSIATYNFVLFRQAFKNFMFAVGISLLASTAYFAVSPISTAHSELLARTGPTIYDVLIALFGGLAGIIAISSKLKGNVIPGVAIATALMPPLCTAGYGLATAQFDFFLGALYLFTINTVFIGIASMAVSQYLNFPIRTIVNVAHRKKVNRIISLVIFIVLIPSIYFGYLLVQKERFAENAGQYIDNVVTFEGNYLLKSKIDAESHTITLIYGGKNFSPEQKEAIMHKADNFKLDNANIIIKQGLNLEESSDENLEVMKLKDELNNLTILIKEKDLQIDSFKMAYTKGTLLYKEIKNLYPEIEDCMYAESLESSDTLNSKSKTAIVLFSLSKKISRSDKDKIENWVKTRLKQEKVKIIYE